ncbi:MAG: hypothetical protein Q8861_00165 [Bacteroidota bacterium]|nr:hypothetical protein [Bacteroidota bacterium]MDP4268544.1 hypothetical protein [Bacteroidota bacterium]
MNKIRFCILVIAVVAMNLVTSCKSDNDVFPVSFTFDQASAIDSVYENDTYVLKGKIVAGGNIEQVQFFRSFTFNNKPDQVEMAGTAKYNLKDTCGFSISVPQVTSTTTIKVVVTQKGGHQDEKSFTIKTIPVNIKTFSGIYLGGWNSGYGSCLEAETGTMQSGSATTDPDVAPLLDVFFDDAKLACTDLDSIYYGVNRLKDTGTRFNKTTLSAADFDKIRSDIYFKDYTAPLKEVAIKEGDVIFFITKGGKRGLIKIISMTEPEGDLLIDEKIQK